eukprot:TRINITY_DN14547_c0_g1_i1.p1 TRINITY_DN14547_c0_g1~~TRINITY_DN14547_c0_g1_i1.p1  ORF type:complete len:369 (-),score=41.60 TRINITY_DN14547_c0_g1_i1:244-1350(-)
MGLSNLSPLHNALILFSFAVLSWASSTWAGGTCNYVYSNGSWVIDDTLPLYNGFNCPYIRKSENCIRHRRRNLSYQKLRWQPNGCNLTRLTADGLSQFLAKKLVLTIGDSLSKNFASSVLCVMNSGRWKLQPFNATYGDLNVTGLEHPVTGTRVTTILSLYLVNYTRRLDGFNAVDIAVLDKTWTKMAKYADVIFISATRWWQSWPNVYERNNVSLPWMSTVEAYQEAFSNVNTYFRNISFNGTVILLSHSPSHYVLPPGIAKNGTFCETNSTLSSQQIGIVVKADDVDGLLGAQKNVTMKGVGPLQLVDVTTMSLPRPDGHVQHYFTRNLGGKDDCTHWCESGVVDAWLELAQQCMAGVDFQLPRAQ